MVDKIPPPFPYFGGKGRVAGEVWQRFGVIKNYVEPFAGSLAVFLRAPEPPNIATLNDLDGFIVNFWRSVKHDPDAVAHFADWPVTEIDLFARHVWLVARKGELAERLMADPDYYDAKIAGWWVWGQSAWIGSGWCSGKGSWTVENGRVVKISGGEGISRQRPHLRNAGRGVNRQIPDLGTAGRGVNRQLPHLRNAGQGVNRPTPISTNGVCEAKSAHLREYMRVLADRLRFARIACGDFERVLGPSVTYKHGLTGVFLDPPYSADRNGGLYAHDSLEVAHRVRDWCVANGDNPLLRIALCGYEGEHNELEALGWQKIAWSANGGYANPGQGKGRENKHLERVWFSPHCIHEVPDADRLI